MTKKLILATILMLSFTLVSCSSKSDDKNNNEALTKPTVEDNSNSSENSDVDNKDNNEDEDKATDEASEPEEKLSLYTIDENTLEPNESSTFDTKISSPLQTKIEELSSVISKEFFEGLPIEVKSIDDVDGKKIATINLSDSEGLSWIPKFQGSLGGQITSNTLIENFLQVNYKGEWIDGVKFLYNDAPIEYDHVYKLSEVQYRN